MSPLSRDFVRRFGYLVLLIGIGSLYVVLLFDGARRENGNGAATWILWVRNMNGEFERISHGGKVLKDTTAMAAEREAM